MKKIMFSERFGLEQAVLAGKKTQTRRIMMPPKKFKGKTDLMLEYHRRLSEKVFYDCVVCDADGHELGQMPLPYEIGDVVAVAQSYKSIYDAMEERDGNSKANEWWCELCDLRIGDGLGPAVTPGYRNKMFVRADLMPHRIRITDLWFERLQDISDEDCLKEGITTITEGKNEVGNAYGWDTKIDALKRDSFFTPRAAFAALINRISGRGTWKSNPWVVAYEFHLQRAHGFPK